MKLVSKACVDFVKKFEGFYPNAYLDIAGVRTLGYGMTGKEIEGLKTVTETQASNMLETLLNNNYAAPIKKNLDSKKVVLKQNEFDALVSMAYNVGVGGLLGSTLYKNICAGNRDKNTITSNFRAWDKATINNKLVSVPGLLRRRTEEAEMFLKVDTIKKDYQERYVREFQKFYNEVTKTTSPLKVDGLYVKATQTSLDDLLVYVKQGKKYKYCLELQQFYNKVTGTGSPIATDGSYGPITQNAYETLEKLIKGEY